MRGLFLVLLAGCTDGKVDLDDTDEEEPLADLGDPFVGIYAAALPGTFRSDCLIDVELYDGETMVASAEMITIGGKWTGTVLPGETLYRAVATWDTCTTGPEGDGTFESSTFSGVKGDFFLFRYTGVQAAFETLVQREDFEGGVADVSFREGTTEDDVAAIAETHGVEAELVDGTAYRISWDTPTAVGKVLTQLSTEAEFSMGAPVWIRVPDWWVGG